MISLVYLVFDRDDCTELVRRDARGRRVDDADHAGRQRGLVSRLFGGFVGHHGRGRAKLGPEQQEAQIAEALQDLQTQLESPPPELLSLLEDCLKYDVEHRPSAEAVASRARALLRPTRESARRRLRRAPPARRGGRVRKDSGTMQSRIASAKQFGSCC